MGCIGSESVVLDLRFLFIFLIFPTPPSLFKSGLELFFHSQCRHYIDSLISLVCFTAWLRPPTPTLAGDGSPITSHRMLNLAGSSGSPIASLQTPHTSAVYIARKVTKDDFPPQNSSCWRMVFHISPNRSKIITATTLQIPYQYNTVFIAKPIPNLLNMVWACN